MRAVAIFAIEFWKIYVHPVDLFSPIRYVISAVKPVLSGHLKIHKTKILMTNGSIMKSILQYFWPAFSDNRYWKPSFYLVFFMRVAA